MTGLNAERINRRTAIASILHVLLDYTDLASMRCGIVCHRTGLRYITQRFLRERTQLHPRRIKRCLQDIEQSEYIILTDKKKMQIDVSERLFFDLGISSQQLFDARAYRFKLDEKISARFPALSRIFKRINS